MVTSRSKRLYDVSAMFFRPSCERFSVTNLRFDDIDSINAAVSEEYGDWGRAVEMTQEMVNQFAELTGDRQWIHVDIERATAGPFGSTIAHGFLTLSLLPRLALSAMPLTGFSQVLNYGADRLRFIAPVPVPAKIHARARLLGANAKSTGTLVKTEVEVRVVDADKPSLIYEMLTLYMN